MLKLRAPYSHSKDQKTPTITKTLLFSSFLNQEETELRVEMGQGMEMEISKKFSRQIFDPT